MSMADKSRFDSRELMETLRDLDFENLGGWPLPVKLGATLLVFVGVLFGGYFFSITGQKTVLERYQNDEKTLIPSRFLSHEDENEADRLFDLSKRCQKF